MGPLPNPYIALLKKFGPYLVILILSVLLVLCHNTNTAVTAQRDSAITQRDSAYGQRDFYKIALDQRDVLLTKQSASIQSLADAAKVNRDTYVAGIKQAQTVSANHAKAAGELMALTAPEGEVGQCRAARQLLEDELTK